MALKAANYFQQLKALLPRGKIWDKSADSILGKLLSTFSEEFARIEQRVEDLVNESDPRTTSELLAEWENFAGLPDGCAQVITRILIPGVYDYELLSLASFTRPSAAYQKDVNGALSLVAANAVRHAVKITDRNQLLYSSQFDVASYPGTGVIIWGRFNLQSVTANAAIGPDGNMSADLLVPSTANLDHGLDQAINGWADNTQTFGYVDAAPAGYNFIRIRLYYKNGSGADVDFDLLNGAVTRVSQGTGGSGVIGEISLLPNGFFRCLVKGANIQTGGTVPKLRVYVMNAANSTVYIGDGVSGVLLARSKYGTGNDIGQYLDTALYPAYTFQLAGKLLIEAAATNYFTNSKDGNGYTVKAELTYSANSILAPNGTMTADAYRETVNNAGHYAERNVGLIANKEQCYSIFIQPVGGRYNFYLHLYANGYADNVNATINLSSGRITSVNQSGNGSLQIGYLEELADGWWCIGVAGKPTTLAVSDLKLRISVVNGSTVYAGNVNAGFNIWISQLEDGLGPPSSPIDTAGVALLRSPEAASIFIEQTIEQRRAALNTKLTLVGGQSRSYFINMAAGLGYANATIDEYQPMNCNDDCNDALYSQDDRYFWQINLPSVGGVFVANCQSPCDSPLQAWGDEVIECRINKYKPAHTTAIFAYV